MTQRQSNPDASRLGILLAIHDERDKQEARYPGTTCASDDLTPTDKATILLAEVGEVSEEAKMLRWPHTRAARGHLHLNDYGVRQRLRKELLQVAAITVAWIEWVGAQDDAESCACGTVLTSGRPECPDCAEREPLPEFRIEDTCCGKCPGNTCYVDQITGA